MQRLAPGLPKLTELAGVSVGALRGRVAELREPESLEQWARLLGGDRRSGVRSLAASCLRRSQAIERERQRVEHLFARSRRLRAEGARVVAGVDEVGVGPLAGPVVAAAVALPDQVDLPRLDDSKRLSASVRQRLALAIREQAVAVGIGQVECFEIDRLNIYRASLEAMRRAVAELARQTPVDHLLVDARTVPGVATAQTAIVHGDREEGSIAAASIVAKVHRDAIMCRLDVEHPGYHFARHMGYGTRLHLDCLQRLGPCPEHRRSFAPVARAAARHPLPVNASAT